MTIQGPFDVKREVKKEERLICSYSGMAMMIKDGALFQTG